MGCVLYHLATLETPFKEDTFAMLMNSILYKSPKPIQRYFHTFNMQLLLDDAERLHIQAVREEEVEETIHNGHIRNISEEFQAYSRRGHLEF